MTSEATHALTDAAEENNLQKFDRLYTELGISSPDVRLREDDSDYSLMYYALENAAEDVARWLIQKQKANLFYLGQQLNSSVTLRDSFLQSLAVRMSLISLMHEHYETTELPPVESPGNFGDGFFSLIDGKRTAIPFWESDNPPSAEQLAIIKHAEEKAQQLATYVRAVKCFGVEKSDETMQRKQANMQMAVGDFYHALAITEHSSRAPYHSLLKKALHAYREALEISDRLPRSERTTEEEIVADGRSAGERKAAEVSDEQVDVSHGLTALTLTEKIQQRINGVRHLQRQMAQLRFTEHTSAEEVETEFQAAFDSLSADNLQYDFPLAGMVEEAKGLTSPERPERTSDSAPAATSLAARWAVGGVAGTGEGTGAGEETPLLRDSKKEATNGRAPEQPEDTGRRGPGCPVS